MTAEENDLDQMICLRRHCVSRLKAGADIGILSSVVDHINIGSSPCSGASWMRCGGVAADWYSSLSTSCAT